MLDFDQKILYENTVIRYVISILKFKILGVSAFEISLNACRFMNDRIG
jgi:hypothetical protein